MVKSHTHGMEHNHYVNIDHAHSIQDPGHSHSYIHAFGGDPYLGQPAAGGAGFYWGSDTYGVSSEGTGITINSIGYDNAWKYSSGSISDTSWTGRTQTDSNNINANENRPENFTVKIWKRTA